MFFTSKLIDREYTETEITIITTEIKHRNQTQHKIHEQQRKDPIFTTKYSPYIKTKDLKESLAKYWEELEKDETLKTLFPNHPIIAYKRNKNIKDTLVKTKKTKQ